MAWQEIKGRRIPIVVYFNILGKYEVSFKVDSYDPRFRLVIDPVLSWNTFLGSSGYDEGYAIALDGSGNMYVAGWSSATWGTPINAH